MQHDAQGPVVVALGVDGLAALLEQTRVHVLHRAELVRTHHLSLAIQSLVQTEVTEFQTPFFIKEDVLRFQVGMDEPVLMHDLHPRVYLSEDVQFLLDREMPPSDVLLQVVGQVLHYQQVLLFVLERLDQVHDRLVATELVLDLDLVVQELLVVVPPGVDLLDSDLLELAVESAGAQKDSAEASLAQSPDHLPVEYLLQVTPGIVGAHLFLLLLLLEQTLDLLVLRLRYEPLGARVRDLLQQTQLAVPLRSAPPLLLRLLNHPSLPVYHLPLLLLLRPPPFLRSLYHHFLMKWLLILEQGSLRHGGQGTGWLGGDRLELHVDLLPLEPHLLLDEQLLLVQLLLVEHLDALIIVLLHPWLFRLGFHLEVAHPLLHLQLVVPVLPLGSGQELAQFARLDTSLVWLSSEHIIIDIIIMDSQPSMASLLQTLGLPGDSSLGSLVDSLLWADKKDQDLLQLFPAHGGMQSIERLFVRGGREQQVTIISNLGVLLLNLSHLPTLSYILASLDPIIYHGVSLDDDELVDYYIAFLKQVTQLVSSRPEQFLSIQSHYPLLSMALLFYRHPENMVRTTVRNIILSLLQTKEASLVDLFIHLPYSTYWNNLTLTLSSTWSHIDRLIESYSPKEASRLQALVHESQDILLFIQDILHLEIPAVNDMLSNAFLWNCLQSSLLNSFTFSKKGCLSISLAMLLLQESLCKLSHPVLLNTITKSLFQTSLEPRLFRLLSRTLSPSLGFVPYGSLEDLSFRKDSTSSGRDSLLLHHPCSDASARLTDLERVLGCDPEYSWLSLGEYETQPQLQPNPVSQVLSSFMFCKDDNLLYSSLSLMVSALRLPGSRQALTDDHLILHIEGLLGSFQQEPPLRVCTAKTVGQLLESLYTSASVSQERLFTNSLVTMYNQVFLAQVNVIYEVLKNPRVIDHFIQVFDEEWLKHPDSNYLELDNRVTYRHLIYYDEQVINSLSPESRQTTDIFQNAKRQIQTLFILARLKALLRGEDIAKPYFQQLKASVYNSIDIEPDSPIKKNKQEMVPCKVSLEGQRWAGYCMTEDVQHLVLAEKKEDNLFRVKKALPLKQSFWSVDKGNKKQLSIERQGKVVQLSFESRSKTESIRNTLDYNRKVAKQFDISIILQYLNKLEKELVPYSEKL